MRYKRNLLRCPICKSSLNKREDLLVCNSCNSFYRTINGIPDMLPPVLDEKIKKSIESWNNINYNYKDHINQSPPERLLSIDRPLIDQCFGGGNVLEVGCGNARLKIAVEKKGCNYVGIDPSLKLLKEGFKEHDLLIRGVGEYLPFPDNYFDTVIGGYHSFRYVELEKGFKECARVLKPGGILVFTLWNYWALNINSILLNLKNLKIPTLNSPKNEDNICNDVLWAKNEVKKLRITGFDVESILSTKKLIMFDLPLFNRIFNWYGYWKGFLGTLIGYDIIFICKKADS